jgi:hypothetical protein
VLPVDTRIRVSYGASQSESYKLSVPKQNADVCCQASAEVVSGDLPRVPCSAATLVTDAGPPSAIQCTLWTNGPTTVDVNASGYVPLNTVLNTRLQDDEKCGVETVEAQLILGRPDGGI